MSCLTNSTVVCCGIKHQQLVQDCIECRWLVTDQTSTIIFQANQVISASGMVDFVSNTSELTKLDVIFSKGSTAIKTLALESQQCLAFTIVNFDTITLKGNAPSSTESASGNLILTPRYQI